VNENVAGGLIGALAGLILLWLWRYWLPAWMVRRRHRRMIDTMAALATVAAAHREVCRALVEDGRHFECPLCHVDTELWERVRAGRLGWMHLVRIAEHQSWLDWDVSVAEIVADTFRNTKEGERP
jgi:hypothetical protein